MLNGQKHLLEFGPFRVDCDERLLLRNGEVVPLPPRVFDTLLLLARHSGHALEKDVLMKELWPETFVEEANLAQHISLLRKALGESATDPQYIETIPRRGYRFLAKVTETVELPAQPAATLRPRRLFAARATVALAFFVGGFVVALLLVRFQLLPERRAISAADYVRITNFTDSAVQPALSPDGKILAFIRGPSTFITAGDVYAMLLPAGEPVALTRDPKLKLAPAFSRDGAHIAYTALDTRRSAFDTWVVPVLGGEPRLLFPNATGLSWIAGGRILFSEVLTGMHMALSTASDNRSLTRHIYIPQHERGMAHFSQISPDGKWVLLVEMDHNGDWLPCRVLPFDGSSNGRPVGPNGRCTAAAWSPDGRWMYFSGAVGGGFHIWRQRRNLGDPEQITFGPTEEEGIAVAPDGHSLITSVGIRQSAIWIHDARGDRQISSDGFASSPTFSSDGTVLYWLRRESVAAGDELWAFNLSSGKSGPALPGVAMQSYDISADRRQVVFSRKVETTSEIWLAPLDRLTSPKRVTSWHTDTPFFGSPGELIFRSVEKEASFVDRIKLTGEERRRVLPNSVIFLYSVSPGGLWAAARIPMKGESTSVAAVAVPLQGGPIRPICSGAGWVRWAPDGRFLYISEVSGRKPNRRTLALPIPAGRALPELPPGGMRSFEEGVALPGARLIEESDVVPGPNPSIYAYTRTDVHRNLFRIPLR